MEYCGSEMLYGPEIRRNDWTTDSGSLEYGGGALLLTEGGTTVTSAYYPYGGGGDVEVAVGFFFTSFPTDGELRVHVHAQPRRDGPRGFVFRFSSRRLEVLYKDEVIGSADHDGAAPSVHHRVVCATLGESYQLSYNGRILAEGRMEPPFVDNEGWIRLATGAQAAGNAAVGPTAAVFEVAEQAIVAPGRPPIWRKTGLLYQEELDPDRFDELWICNTEEEHARPLLSREGYTFRRMSNALLRQRFDAPIAVDYIARPVPSTEHSSGVTDAIFVWMADAPDGPDAPDGLEHFLSQQTAAGDASLQMLLPLPFYWVDFGGTNNVTTRLRKNPYRHLMRQYTDRRRLLRRDHTYRVTVAQYGSMVEFWVDGDPMIRIADPTPLTEGHVGVRAFCSDLELLGLSVWRIAAE